VWSAHQSTGAVSPEHYSRVLPPVAVAASKWLRAASGYVIQSLVTPHTAIAGGPVTSDEIAKVLSTGFWLIRPWAGLIVLGAGLIVVGFASSPRFDRRDGLR
jgi:hypothetical protein